MGIADDSGAVLAGDPIPAAPGANGGGGINGNIFFDGEGNSAIVGDNNLWDSLI